ncbi:hypothetical protein Tco_0292203 [Tanacetum coccineum]
MHPIWRTLPTWLDNFYKNGAPSTSYTTLPTAFTGTGDWDYLLFDKHSLIIFLSSETSVVRAATSGEIPGVDEFELTLATTALFRELRTLDLHSIIFKHSRGILSKKFPPAAEFNEY